MLIVPVVVVVALIGAAGGHDDGFSLCSFWPKECSAFATFLSGRRKGAVHISGTSRRTCKFLAHVKMHFLNKKNLSLVIFLFFKLSFHFFFLEISDSSDPLDGP